MAELSLGLYPPGKLNHRQIIKPQAKHYQPFAFLLHLKRMCQVHYLWETERDFLFIIVMLSHVETQWRLYGRKKLQTRGLIFTLAFFLECYDYKFEQGGKGWHRIQWLVCYANPPAFIPPKNKQTQTDDNLRRGSAEYGLQLGCRQVPPVCTVTAIKCLNKQVWNRKWNTSGVKRFGPLNSLTLSWCLIFSPVSSAGERDVWKHSSCPCLSLRWISSSPVSCCLFSPQRPAPVLGLWWDSGRPPQVRKSGLRPPPADEAALALHQYMYHIQILSLILGTDFLLFPFGT